jgi:hypothetical protein
MPGAVENPLPEIEAFGTFNLDKNPRPVTSVILGLNNGSCPAIVKLPAVGVPLKGTVEDVMTVGIAPAIIIGLDTAVPIKLGALSGKGAPGTVKLEVYRATPLVTRISSKYPVTKKDPGAEESPPIVGAKSPLL